MEYNILIKAVHISGKLNYLPDLLSRLQINQFKIVAQQHMDPDRTDVTLIVSDLT
jgi:hypothetical protein